jgi:hypothetical protein
MILGISHPRVDGGHKNDVLGECTNDIGKKGLPWKVPQTKKHSNES